MLLRNFKNILVSGFGGSVAETVTTYDGTKVSGSFSLGSAMNLFSVQNYKMESLGNSVSTFVFGNDTSTVTEADYFINNRLDDSADFVILSSNRLVPGGRDENAEIIATQNWQYTGENDYTITQIALMTRLQNRTYAIIKQNLENPITVHKNDSFTITCTVFGSLATEVE